MQPTAHLGGLWVPAGCSAGKLESVLLLCHHPAPTKSPPCAYSFLELLLLGTSETSSWPPKGISRLLCDFMSCGHC